MKKTFSVFCVLTCVFLMATGVLANSAKPPDLIIILEDAPRDVEIMLFDDGQELTGDAIFFQGVNYIAYDYDYYNRNNSIGLTLLARSGKEEFTVDIPANLLRGYESMVKLNYPTQTVSHGSFPARSNALIVLRLLLTLVLEGMVLWLFGFRERRSWMVFLVVNVVTQTILSYAITGINPYRSYYFFDLIGWEFCIIVAECVLYKILIKEKRPVITYGIVANLCSLIFGAVILSMLPL